MTTRIRHSSGRRGTCFGWLIGEISHLGADHARSLEDVPRANRLCFPYPERA